MTGRTSTQHSGVREQLLAVSAELRPELHRYCARLVGSVFDGEDIVQDVLARALAAADTLDPATPLRPWLFRSAHNRAVDHLRSQKVRRSEPIEAAAEMTDDRMIDPDEALARQEAVEAAFSRFVELPVAQRGAVILKDVLGYSLKDISDLLELSVDAVKAALSRGRARLRQINAARPPRHLSPRPASAEALRFSALFNQRNWDALRSLLAEDVRLTQATFDDRVGRADVGTFFSIYAKVPEFHLVPAFMDDGDGEEVIAVFASPEDEQPSYLMKLDWRDSRIVRIRDFRYARYVLEGARLVPAG